MKKMIVKFNGSLRAILCSKCNIIIKIGADFTEEERKASKGEAHLGPQYCIKCKK